MSKPTIVLEDNHLLVVEKPSGLLIQEDETRDPTLTDWTTEYIRKKYKKLGNVFCHPCHRLDRPVSGLVIFAKTSKALERMNRLFREHEVKKSYLAVVKGTPSNHENTVIHWLDKDEKRNIAKAFGKQKGNSKRAELSYRLLASLDKLSLLQVMPKTGRPHQIRVQMKAMGHPIKGDLKYGYTSPNQDKSIDLHAFRLNFIHPVKKEEVTVISKPNWSKFKAFIDELD